MTFLLDEDVPLQLRSALIHDGHDVVRVAPATPDPAVAVRAREEKRVLITLDKDFTNTALYLPTTLTIIHIRIHPPYAPAIVEAVRRLLASLPAADVKGLILLHAAGFVRITS